MRSYYLRIFWIILLFFIFLIGGLVAFGGYYFQVREIELVSNREDQNLRYSSLRKMLEYTKKHNLLILSTDYLEKSLLIRFPELESIQIEKQLPSTLIITPVTDPVVIKWGWTIENDPTQHFGYITNKGMLLEHGDPTILTVYDKQPRSAAPEFYTSVLQESEIQNFIDTKQKLEEIILREVTIIDYLRNAQEIHFIDESNVSYWFYLEKDLDYQMQKLKFLVESQNVLGGNLSYIDLRITKKVLYK